MSLSTVLDGIEQAERDAGREVGSVRLVAVSKRHPLAAIERALAAGQLDFGENYAQELRDKARELSGPRWHYIGRIQRNKVKYIAPVAYRVHALENVAQAEALAAKSPDTLKALVSVNISREENKGGVAPADLPALLDAIHQVQGLDVVGLMGMAPIVDDPRQTAPCFQELADLARKGRDRGHALAELSMGMSSDYRVAIEHGATWVRIGTAVFGARPTS